jgi:hypothetical protein
MCLVCIEWNKGKLTKEEALQILREMRKIYITLDETPGTEANRFTDEEKRHIWDTEQKVKLDDHKRWLEERDRKLAEGFDESDQT